MSLLGRMTGLFDEPPPSYAFEISAAGISWGVRASRRGQAPEFNFQPLPDDVLAISPVKENLGRPEVFESEVARLVPTNGNRKRRDAALILPDYCARVAVLDFDSLPGSAHEQLALVRFRMKKTVPFDMDAAALGFQVQKTPGKKLEVVVAAAAIEIVARYEAPFRAAGFSPGLVTTSTLAAMDLMPATGMNVLARRSGQVLTVAVCDGRQPKLVRCVETVSSTLDEVMSVLFPTFAYAEDELARRPERMLTCGFGSSSDELARGASADLGVPVEPLRSLWGPAAENNAGLLGWLQAIEAAR